MKAVRYIVCILLIVACLGLLAYQYFVEQQLETKDLTRAVLIILGAVLSMLRKPRSKVISPKATYEKAYSAFVQNAFHDEPKLEKQLYEAIHDYNLNKPDKALQKLKKLRKECQRTNELRAVSIFTGLCLDDMQLHGQAIEQYQAAANMGNSSTLESNIGLCYQKLGNFEEAERRYETAIQLDPKNPYARNNLSALYFRQGNYDEALDVAVETLAIDGKMRQALTTAALCCGILGYEEKYEQYYRQAVSNGADGNAIKESIKNMDPSL